MFLMADMHRVHKRSSRGTSRSPAARKGTGRARASAAVITAQEPNLARVDLNLLVVLEALLEHGSVTAAASRLGLSQSATSHALARLRQTLGDPLLVRAPGGLVPTARARALAPVLQDALAILRRVVAGPPRFEPSTAARRFVVGTADYVELVLVPELMSRLANTAPRIDLWLKTYEDDLGDALGRGDFDLAIGPERPGNDRPGIRTRPLFEEQFVCVVRKGHPALGRRWTAESFARLSHAFIAPRGKPGGAVDDALAAMGLSRRVALALPHFMVAPFVVAQTDLVLTLPQRVAATLVPHLPLVVVPPPLPVPGFRMVMLWHERVQHEPAHAWLRETLIEVAAEVAPAAALRRRAAAEVSLAARPR
ncbi:MAG: LysR family transcriptional regulator [Nannocystaceae bacterium]